MPYLTLALFGAFQAQLDNQPLTTFHSTKVQGLLAYLAVEAARPHTREMLMALFWPDDAPQSAQQSLRQALYTLRRTLGDTENSAGAPFLLVTRQTVQMNQVSQVTLDVTTFLQQVQQGNLAQAVALYAADLLVGMTTDSAAFEEWLRATREYLHNLALNALDQLTQQRLAASDYTEAINYARHQLSLEPWREEAHRQVMMALARSGERSAALAQYESCCRVLIEELGVDPTEETVALYEQIRSGQLRRQTARPNPLPAVPRVGEELPAIRHNLPPQPTPFIGRTTDLEYITVRLGDPTCRLLTIVGPGGMGKTRLAIQAAQMLVETSVGDGVFFVALAGVASPALLVSTIATALNFTFYGSGEPQQQLLAYLQKRALLLLLDNCEHLLDGIDLVSELLGAAPQVKVLATSREPLNLREEWLHPLSGMSFPSDATATAPVDSYTAVQFFVQCARQMKPGFDLTAEAAAVVRICRLVEGMPLGIELATTWLKLFSCGQIAREIEQSLDFLSTTLRNVPTRHRSMKAVFEHSWALLSDQKQQVLQRLAVFHGGFDRTAAQQVAGASFPLLVALAEKSLIQVGPGERYQMHELLRQFAEEKLRSHPAELECIQGEHARYYTRFLAQQESRLKGHAHLTAMQQTEQEIENVRAAWNWAVTHDKVDALDEALDSLAYFLETRLWHDEAIVIFENAITMLEGHPPEDRHQLLIARILAKQGIAYAKLSGEVGKPLVSGIVQQLEQCLTMLDRFHEPKAAGDVAWALSYLVDEMSQELRLKALAIYEKYDDRWNMARTLEGLGFNANLLGDFEAARYYYQRGITLCQELGDRRVLGDIQAVLSETHRALGNYDEAARLAYSSLIERTAVGNKRGIAYSLYVLGALAWRMGNYTEAHRYSQQSHDTFAEIGLLRGIDFAHSNLGTIACTLGDYAEARRQFLKILQSNLTRDSFPWARDSVPWGLVGMAEVLRQEGQPEVAIEVIEQVLRHPNAWREAKERAANLLVELQAILPPEVVAAAQDRGRTADLRTTVAQLIGTTLV